MRNALLLLLIGVGQVALVALYPRAAWLLAWSCLSFCAVAVAYALQQPRILLLPFLLLTWLLWYCQTRFSREAACNEVAPGLWTRRRVGAKELLPGVPLIVALTSEFDEPQAVRAGHSYLCLPMLDNAAPAPEAFRNAVKESAAHKGMVYIHCALGHGRSALLAAAVLMVRGVAAGPEEALAQVKWARPAVRLNREQWEFLKKWR